VHASPQLVQRQLKDHGVHVEAFINRGATLEELKRFEDALASYAEAIRLKPDYAEPKSDS
jgi:cytochrome c-type biogenesis protein CcmH/NrfG